MCITYELMHVKMKSVVWARPLSGRLAHGVGGGIRRAEWIMPMDGVTSGRASAAVEISRVAQSLRRARVCWRAHAYIACLCSGTRVKSCGIGACLNQVGKSKTVGTGTLGMLNVTNPGKECALQRCSQAVG